MNLPPSLTPDIALFLDFDGTLVEIASTPDGIAVPRDLAGLLSRVAERLGGALAVVTGRPLAEIDRLLAPLQVPAAGLHGLEYRSAIGARVIRAAAPADLDILRTRVRQSGLIDAGVRLEDKGLALAIHYREAPDRMEALANWVGAATSDLHDLHVIHGKKVLEVKARGQDKGHAVASFLGNTPFAGRVPVFVGDDVTDEDGFAAARIAGGYGIKVGIGASNAPRRLADVNAVHGWLDSFAREAANVA